MLDMRKLLLWSITVCMIVLLPGSVALEAISDEQRRLFKSGILNYDVEEASCRTKSTGTTTSGGNDNTNYAGEQVWSDDDLSKIEANKSAYAQASEEADVPWQMLAVIHKRESNLGRVNPGNGQGVYQFYNKDGGPYPAGPVSEIEFLRQTKFMAERLQSSFVIRNHSANAGPLVASGTPDNVIKDTFFSYNGRSSGYKAQAAGLGFDRESEGHEGSPYVMNRFDANRDPATAASGTWGQVKTDGGPIEYPANQQFGAWVLYLALGGVASGGSGVCGSESSGSLVNAEGYSFPIAPQKKSENGRVPAMSALPCTGTCHHDGTPAFDLNRLPGGVETVGTELYAISDGTIASVRDGYDGHIGCFTLQLESTKDSFFYAYLHTSNPAVQQGQTVEAGQKIAEVGRAACGRGIEHLHIDRGCVRNGVHQKGGSKSCRDEGMVPLLNSIFEGLPE